MKKKNQNQGVKLYLYFCSVGIIPSTVHYFKINFFSLSNDDLLNKNNDVFLYITKTIL
jgi:hypothetical protein